VKTTLQLIQLYTLGCEMYDNGRRTSFQRLSNNTKPGGITDQELIAIYWFSHLQRRYEKKAMHEFISDYWREFFPSLPSYQTFVARLNQLEATWQSIGLQLQMRLCGEQAAEVDHLINSMPIALARGGHAYTARFARETADIGYCASKKLFFHGVKLHVITSRRSGHLPQPQQMWLREASCNDLRSLKEQEIELPQTTLFGDKAYADSALTAVLAAQGTTLQTPQKKLKGQELSTWEKYYNRCVNRLRQPVESLFHWIQ
jgi:Transposase DDE domain